MVMDADGFFQLHDMFAWQPIRVSRFTNPNWLPCKHIVELEETVSIHNHAKGVPDATMTSVAFQLAYGPKEPLKRKKKKKKVKCPRFFFSAALLDRMRAGTQLMSSLRRAPLLHGYGCCRFLPTPRYVCMAAN